MDFKRCIKREDDKYVLIRKLVISRVTKVCRREEKKGVEWADICLVNDLCLQASIILIMDVMVGKVNSILPES